MNSEKDNWRTALIELLANYYVLEGGRLDKPDSLTDEEWADVDKEALAKDR